MEVKNKKVVVLGAARSGMAAVSLLHQLGALVFVSDVAPKEDKIEQLEILEGLGIPYEFGEHSDKTYNADFIVLSPGIPLTSQIVQGILKRKIPIYSEVEVASWFCKSKIIAITGSNGKTTTTTLLGEMLKLELPQVIVAGNIGAPLSGQVLNSLSSSWASVEISSFQLETIDSFHPTVAVILNLAPNHLDWYNSYEDYIKAKLRILINLDKSDHIIYNADDILLAERLRECKAKKLRFSLQNDQVEAFTKDNSIYLNKYKVLDIDQVLLKGPHNYMNAMAAGLAARCANISYDAIAQVLTTFEGIEHRLEYVTTVAGIQFINDSKATTIEALEVALRSFSTAITLIAGGKDKGSDFSKVNDLIKNNVRAVVLIGMAKEKMAKCWHDLTPIHFAASLSEAVERAFHLTKKGDTVLLSPACSSFDMFTDFEDRGKKYKEYVQKLKIEYENQYA
jgi:UDP-N-acetylmuramoylalanine--D-glutamate ligase